MKDGQAACWNEELPGRNCSERCKSEQGVQEARRMMVEVICERAHCVIYEYAIVTVKFIADEFEGRIRVKPVVRRGSKKNVDRYLELCRLNGQHLSVPAILMNGKLKFTYVPGIEDLRSAMEDSLAEWESSNKELNGGS